VIDNKYAHKLPHRQTDKTWVFMDNRVHSLAVIKTVSVVLSEAQAVLIQL
jgi:hypothetical protein